MLSTLLSFVVLVLGLMLFHKWNPFLGSVLCGVFAFYGIKKVLQQKLTTVVKKFCTPNSPRPRLPRDGVVFDLPNNVIQVIHRVIRRRNEPVDPNAANSDTCFGLSARSRGYDVSQHSPLEFINAEIKTFVDNIRDRYIVSWYSDVSANQDFPRELEYIIEDVLRALYGRLAAIDPCELLQLVIPVAHAHFRKFKECLAMKGTPGDVNIDDGGLYDSLRDAPRKHFRFSHVAFEGEASEKCYLKSVTSLLVSLLEPPHVLSSPATNALVIDILTCNILVPIVDLMCDPEWLNWAVLYLCSLEDDVDILAMASNVAAGFSETAHEKEECGSGNLYNAGSFSLREQTDIPVTGGQSNLLMSSSFSQDHFLASGDTRGIPDAPRWVSPKSSKQLDLPDVYCSLQDDSVKIYNSGNEVEEAIEAEEFLGSQMFLDIWISRTESRSVPGKGVHTVYCIEYETCKKNDSSEIAVSEVRTTWRRFREFLDFQGRLEKNHTLEKHLKGIRGPSRWLGSILSDKKNVQERRIFLQQYLKDLCTREAIVNSREFHKFLDFEEEAAEAPSSSGMMKSASSSNRLDRVLAQGVKSTLELLKTALPGDDHSLLSPVSPLEGNLVLFTDYLPSDIEYSFSDREMSQVLQQGMFNFLDNFDQASSPEFSPPLTPSCLHHSNGSPSSASRWSCEEQSPLELAAATALPLGTLSLSRGADDRDLALRRLAQSLHAEIPLFSAVIDFIVDSLEAGHFCKSAHFTFCFELLFGKLIERILEEKVRSVFASANCTIYMHRLHQQLWEPGEEEPSFNEAQVARGLAKMVPGWLRLALGAKSVAQLAGLLAKSIQDREINKCLVYELMDVLADFLLVQDNSGDILGNS